MRTMAWIVGTALAMGIGCGGGGGVDCDAGECPDGAGEDGGGPDADSRCTSSADCPGTVPICDMSTGACGPCANDNECTARDPATPFCTPAGQCSAEAMDTTPPTVEVVPNAIYDEREYGAGYVSGTYAPCLYRASSGAATTELSYDVNATPAPAPTSTTYKFAINTGAQPFVTTCPPPDWAPGGAPPAGMVWDAEANPIDWHLFVNDAFDGTAVASVEFSVKPPGATEFGSMQMAEEVTDLPGVSHRVRVDTSVAPELATTNGVWEVQVVATDRAGNQRAPSPIKWTHWVLPGPVFVTVRSSISGVTPVSGENPFAYGLSGTLDAAPLRSNDLLAAILDVSNPTPYSVTLDLMAQMSASYSRTLMVRNPRVAKETSGGANCTDTQWYVRGTTTCLSTPKPADAGPTTTSGTASSFVSATRVLTLPAMGSQEVQLNSGPYTFLWPGSGTPTDQTVMFEAGGSAKLYAWKEMEWGERRRFLLDPGPPPIYANNYYYSAKLHYLQDFSLMASGTVAFALRYGSGLSFSPPAIPTRNLSLLYMTSENATVPGYQAPPASD